MDTSPAGVRLNFQQLRQQPEDIRVAKEALDNALVEWVGPATLDEKIDIAFDKLNVKEREHKNGIVGHNCKTESAILIDAANALENGWIYLNENKKHISIRYIFVCIINFICAGCCLD